MTNFEDQLRDTLVARAHDAPETGVLLRDIVNRSEQRKRRSSLASAAVASTAVVAAAGIIVATVFSGHVTTRHTADLATNPATGVPDQATVFVVHAAPSVVFEPPAATDATPTQTATQMFDVFAAKNGKTWNGLPPDMTASFGDLLESGTSNTAVPVYGYRQPTQCPPASDTSSATNGTSDSCSLWTFLNAQTGALQYLAYAQ